MATRARRWALGAGSHRRELRSTTTLTTHVTPPCSAYQPTTYLPRRESPPSPCQSRMRVAADPGAYASQCPPSTKGAVEAAAATATGGEAAANDAGQTPSTRHVLSDRVLLPGEFWHARCQVRELEGGARGVFCTGTIASGTVLVRANGLTMPGNSVDVMDLYSSYVDARSSPQDPEKRELCRRIDTNLCPRDPEAADALVSKDATLNNDGYRQQLRALVSAPESSVTLHELCRTAIRFEQNGFVEGVFPLACGFNHACRPNCLAHFDREGGQLVVVTIDGVGEGAELCINYLPESSWHLPTDQRRSILEPRYGFWCGCERCDRTRSNGTSVGIAEVDLESMRCPHDDCENGMCCPVDDHTNRESPPDGWKACNVCGRAASAQAAGSSAGEHPLDAALRACYRHAVQASAWSAHLERLEVLDATQIDAALQHLETASQLLRSKLHPNHWLMCKLHLAAEECARSILIHSREGPASDPGAANRRARAAAACAHHAKALIPALSPVVPQHSNLFGVLLQRAANAVGIEDQLSGASAPEVGETADRGASSRVSAAEQEAMELRRQALAILQPIWCSYR